MLLTWRGFVGRRLLLLTKARAVLTVGFYVKHSFLTLLFSFKLLNFHPFFLSSVFVRLFLQLSHFLLLLCFSSPHFISSPHTSPSCLSSSAPPLCLSSLSSAVSSCSSCSSPPASSPLKRHPELELLSFSPPRATRESRL